MSKRNNCTKLAVLSLLGVLGLASCGSSSDEVYAKPANYDDPVVVIEDLEEKIQNNILSVIYDAMHDGSIPAETLDKALYRYAESVFGVYNGVTLEEGSTEITLKEAVAPINANGDTAKTFEFIRKHKAYWTRNEDGKHINDDDPDNPIIIEEDAEFTPCNSEVQRLVSKWEAIENRIAENMYARALGGSYTEKHFFREIKYLKALHEQGEKVDYASAKEDFLEPMVVPYTLEKKDVFNEGVLHREYYQDSVEATDYSACKFTFIEDKVIPEIYNDLLIEQYLLNEDVAAIRNSRARKINVIKINKYSSFANNADMLVKELVKEIYAGAPTGDMLDFDVETNEAKGDKLFEKYAKIAKGLYEDIKDDEEAKTIINTLNGNASDVYALKTGKNTGLKYYDHTEYGDLVKEYEKLLDAYVEVTPGNYAWDWNKLDESLYSTYTSNGTTTLNEGFDQKVIDIQQKQSITKGWYIQNQSPSLDSNGTINDRLFKLSVANAKVELDEDAPAFEDNYAELEAADRFVKKDGVWQLREEASETENKFLCSINGTYYLKFEGQYSGDDWKNDIVYDDGSAYYIVQVREAVKDAKLRSLSDLSYNLSRNKGFLEEVIDEVAKILGETGNYASVSKEYWLKKMDIKYHDQKVYDYFKENYPDLFK